MGEAGDRAAGWMRPMAPRDPNETHRSATPLELLFDLCFVVAIALAASHLHHDLAHGHVGHAVVSYALVFFAIWWAWMGFTWFASAYDTDDGPHRLKTFVQMAGVLVLAAGIPRAFEQRDFTVVTVGYAIMRVGLVASWLRAARADPPRRRTALRYAFGITACQLGWLALLLLPQAVRLPGWGLLVPAELLVPAWAERAAPTTWHPHHISERYGLMTLIVLGESILAATLALQRQLDAGGGSLGLLALAVGGLLIVFGLWWMYFGLPGHRVLTSLRVAFLWGYGHALLFGSIAAAGAGLAVAADAATGHVALDAWGTGLAIGVPVSVFLVTLGLLFGGRTLSTPALGALAVAVPAILLVSRGDHAALGIGLLLAALAAVVGRLSPRPD